MTRESLDLICYKYDGWAPRIRPAAPKRRWMDETGERYAYRCLPLAIANSHGWELLSPIAFEARWDGDIHMESVEIRVDPGYADHLKPVSLFGYGTITFHVEGIFRTPPGWNLWVGGSPNSHKDGIQPLGGVIETDWSPYTFTMNWRFTRPDHWVRFEENEPIAFFFPVERGRVLDFDPRVEPLEEQPELRRQFEAWSASRTAFQKWVQETNPPNPSDKWQKLYYRGLGTEGEPGPADHQTKLRLKPFALPGGGAMEFPEARICPVPHGVTQAETSLRASPADNVLFQESGAPKQPVNLIAPDMLTLTLDRIGFDARPRRAQLRTAPPPRSDDALALRRRDWIADVQTRQRALSEAAWAVERVAAPTSQAFLDLYYAPSRPVIITGALAGWPALERWTPAYLAETVGGAEVEVQGGRDGGADYERAKERHRRRLPFDAFIAEVADGWGNDLYMTASNSAANQAALEPLNADLGTLDPYLTRARGMMWIGPGGTFTPLHFDLTNNLIVQVTGSKQVILLPPSETQYLYNDHHVFSAVHDITDEERLERYPLARRARMHELTLAPGEILFVPIGWWHQVTALDFSVTVTHTNFRWPNEGHAQFPEG